MSKVVNPYDPYKTGKDFPLWFQFFIGCCWVVIPSMIGAFLACWLFRWLVK